MDRSAERVGEYEVTVDVGRSCESHTALPRRSHNDRAGREGGHARMGDRDAGLHRSCRRGPAVAPGSRASRRRRPGAAERKAVRVDAKARVTELLAVRDVLLPDADDPQVHPIDVVAANPTLGLGVSASGRPDETQQLSREQEWADQRRLGPAPGHEGITAMLGELERLARSRPRSGRAVMAKASTIRTLECLGRGRRVVPPCPPGWYPCPSAFEELDRAYLEPASGSARAVVGESLSRGAGSPVWLAPAVIRGRL
jgi:hypothetical protein